MKYFCTYEQLDFETNSTDYLEFHWGGYDASPVWAKDSLYISGRVFDRVCGMKLLCRSGALPDFDFYGNTLVTRDDWVRMKRILSSMPGSPAEFIAELDAWVADGFDDHDCFTIRGE